MCAYIYICIYKWKPCNWSIAKRYSNCIYIVILNPMCSITSSVSMARQLAFTEIKSLSSSPSSLLGLNRLNQFPFFQAKNVQILRLEANCIDLETLILIPSRKHITRGVLDFGPLNQWVSLLTIKIVLFSLMIWGYSSWRSPEITVMNW